MDTTKERLGSCGRILIIAAVMLLMLMPAPVFADSDDPADEAAVTANAQEDENGAVDAGTEEIQPEPAEPEESGAEPEPDSETEPEEQPDCDTVTDSTPDPVSASSPLDEEDDPRQEDAEQMPAPETPSEEVKGSESSWDIARERIRAGLEKSAEVISLRDLNIPYSDSVIDLLLGLEIGEEISFSFFSDGKMLDYVCIYYDGGDESEEDTEACEPDSSEDSVSRPDPATVIADPEPEAEAEPETAPEAEQVAPSEQECISNTAPKQGSGAAPFPPESGFFPLFLAAVIKKLSSR